MKTYNEQAAHATGFEKGRDWQIQPVNRNTPTDSARRGQATGNLTAVDELPCEITNAAFVIPQGYQVRLDEFGSLQVQIGLAK